MSRARVDGERGGTVSARAIVALALMSGLLLAIAGVSVPTWMAPPGGSDAGAAAALALFQALTVEYLAVDFAGVGLIYVAAVVYAVTLWRVHRATSWALIVSTALLFLGFAVVPLALSFLAASIVVYGVAYVLLGVVTVRLEVARP